jgi:hypothetical protein
MAVRKGLSLDLDRLGEQAAGAGAQHLGQGIVDLIRLTKPRDVGRAVHGVLCGRTIVHNIKLHRLPNKQDDIRSQKRQAVAFAASATLWAYNVIPDDLDVARCLLHRLKMRWQTCVISESQSGAPLCPACHAVITAGHHGW